MKRLKKMDLFTVCNALIMTLVVLLSVYPLYYAVVNSLNDGTNTTNFGMVQLWPRQFSLDSWRMVVKDPAIPTALGITTSRTVIVTVCQLIFTSMFAYAFSRPYLRFKKCRKEDDNILFIDASKEFEKVKTQNKLRPQHIKKIVDTYRERKEIEKYSHLATLQEVAENDYNLNIPRYVDTFEEEEPIDIHAVMKEIKDLEAKRADLDKEIEGYLKELGLVE